MESQRRKDQEHPQDRRHEDQPDEASAADQPQRILRRARSPSHVVPHVRIFGVRLGLVSSVRRSQAERLHGHDDELSEPVDLGR